MEKAFRSRYVIGETGKVSQPQRFFLYQETQHCGWEKRISAYVAIIYRVGLSHSCKCVLAWEGYGLIQEKTLDRPAHYL
ncbi:hypothetical protein DW904_21445 [Ruminococcus sp. AM42-11]|nr:hypothetical protein DW904_21445 [Ruminococcus sp. AM42-11]